MESSSTPPQHTRSFDLNNLSRGGSTYSGIHSSGFRDFLLKPELLRAIVDCGFEHPSDVQQRSIPQAMLGTDVLCQAKSGMGKTAVFVLAVLQQLEQVHNEVTCLVLCHTRELAHQISTEFKRFTSYLGEIKIGVLYGGVDVVTSRKMLQSPPSIIVGTPGRVLHLVKDGTLDLSKLKFFILDECDKMLEQLDMRRDVQEIFRNSPHEKQVMMFSATLANEIRPVCRKFMKDPMEIFVDDEAKLRLHGLQQHYIEIKESDKKERLIDLLDALEFNQVVIFVKSVSRAKELNHMLSENSFPSIAIHSGIKDQVERIKLYQQFKEFKKRIMVATDIFGRGIDIERVNIVFNFDMPENSDSYLHRVGRAGRFGTKGLTITLVSSTEDVEILNQVQSRFDVEITPLPAQIDSSAYMTS